MNKQKSIILLHNKKVTPDDILDILSSFIVEKFKVSK